MTAPTKGQQEEAPGQEAPIPDPLKALLDPCVTSEHIRLACEVARKAAWYCQSQPFDEPSILALAEQLAAHNLTDRTLLLAAVTKIGGSSDAADPSFHMTPARIVTEALALKGEPE